MWVRSQWWLTSTWKMDKLQFCSLECMPIISLGRILFCYHTKITVSIALIIISLRVQRWYRCPKCIKKCWFYNFECKLNTYVILDIFVFSVFLAFSWRNLFNSIDFYDACFYISVLCRKFFSILVEIYYKKIPMNSVLMKQEDSKDINSMREILIAGKKCECQTQGNLRKKGWLYGSTCL